MHTEPRVTRTRARPSGRAIGAGVSAGLIGGLAMMILAMIVAAAIGGGFWAPPKMIAATLMGGDALFGGIGTILLGLLIHFTVAAIWGAIFAAIVPLDISGATELGLALLFAIGVFFLMTYIVLPLVNPIMYERINHWWFFVEHLAYGVGLALALPIRHGIEHRPRRTVHI